MNAAPPSDAQLGRLAAEKVISDWGPDLEVEEKLSLSFGNAAVQRLAESVDALETIFKVSQKKSQLGAQTLSPRKLQGLVETLQNADDVGATELRFAVRRRAGRADLLISHNGAPLTLANVAAMTLPWLSTKEDDPSASGRFGIGQMTLFAIGRPIDAHCHPYSFRIGEPLPRTVDPETSIKGIYDPSARETLFVVSVGADFDEDELEDFVRELGSRSLTFLRSVQRIALIDLTSGDVRVDHSLQRTALRRVEVKVRDQPLEADVSELIDSEGNRFVRYFVEAPHAAGEERQNKATGDKTILGVSIPAGDLAQGGIYDRVPFDAPCRLIVGLNAQFDPDTSRAHLQKNSWNVRRFQDLGDLLASAAIDLCEHEPLLAWSAIPLSNELPDGCPAWLEERYSTDIIDRVQNRVADEFRTGLPNSRKSLSEVAYEHRLLDGLLSDADQMLVAPGFATIRSSERDSQGRWRRVLEDLDHSHLIDIPQASALLELEDAQLGDRNPSWFLAFAAAALEADCFDEYSQQRGFLLADGSRVAPPRHDEPRSLVTRLAPRTLPDKLGVALEIHPVYTTDEPAAQRVLAGLADNGLLTDAVDTDQDLLELLARGMRNPIRVSDEAIRELRDTFERLPEDRQRSLGQRIGRALLLRGRVFDGGTPESVWVAPAESYLPAQIDRDKHSFAKAALTTPGIEWLDRDYARVLKAGSRAGLGPQAFLGRLGAQMFPRLVTPSDAQRVYQRDSREARPIYLWNMPEIQRIEIQALRSPTHLLNDRTSPDLDVVIADIIADPVAKSRRQRARALLGVLIRGWSHYSQDLYAEAVFAYNGELHSRGKVLSTWLARAASEPWLPSATGRLNPPCELHLLTEANRLAIGDRKSQYVMALEDAELRSPALAALRVRRGPSAAGTVAALEQLRDSGDDLGHDKERQILTAYHLLSLACPRGEGSSASRPVDDLTVGQLRSRFEGVGTDAGLIFVDGGWYRTSQIFRGQRIFGTRRLFAPIQKPLEPLWATLQVDMPTALDCLDVLRELAAQPLSSEDEAIIIESMPLLASQLDTLTPQARGKMKRLPLWTGRKWNSTRPVFAIDDESVAEALRENHPVWKPGFRFDRMEELLNALGVTHVLPEDFTPIVGTGYGAVEGSLLGVRFAVAVDLLKNALARNDLDLSKSIAVRWEELACSQLIIDPSLEISASLPGQPALTAPTSAHLTRDPLALFARSPEDVGSPDSGGRAIATLFTGDRQKVAWAWATMWSRAEAGQVTGRLLLSSDDVPEEIAVDRLTGLQSQADSRRAAAPGEARKPAPATGKRPPVTVRDLKDLSELVPSKGALVNKGAQTGGLIIRPRRSPSLDVSPRAGNSPPAAQKQASVLPPTDVREDLAYSAVKRALALDDDRMRDLRNRRGIGADAMDEMRQFFEIKMASGPDFPSEIDLTPNEVERARSDPDGFFLAVVAGLEKGAGKLRVRFIFNPLNQLALQPKSSLTFGGVRDAEALDYSFDAPDPNDQHSD